MRTIIILAFAVLKLSALSAQLVAKVEVKEPIQGLCNTKEVYSPLPGLNGQKQAVCTVPDEEIAKRLSSVIYLRDNPTFKDKGMVGLWINCKGEMVKCEMDNRTKDTVLDGQIVAVFSALGKWEAGSIDGKPVDTYRLFSFDIKKGKITLH